MYVSVCLLDQLVCPYCLKLEDCHQHAEMSVVPLFVAFPETGLRSGREHQSAAKPKYYIIVFDL